MTQIARLINKKVDSRIGRRARARNTLISSGPRDLRRYGIDLKSRVVGAEDRTISFADAANSTSTPWIWATGYRPDYSWIELPVLDERGQARHRRGVTDVPGLYFLGLSWQHTRGSALIGRVKDDAAFLAGRIAAGAKAPVGAEPAVIEQIRSEPITQGA